MTEEIATPEVETTEEVATPAETEEVTEEAAAE